ncbi:MAG: DUF4040 domain-containing protein [Phycisphaeraceae bacterium]|nr:DUF4040 domain-containing protein [Phycisphaeraceae bacterium]
MAAPSASHLHGRPMRPAECAAFVMAPLVSFLGLLWLLLRGEVPLTKSLSWVPSLGIDFAFRIDGLSALMLALITGVGVAVFIYAAGYLSGHPHQRRLFVMLTAFMLAMIGCVTADDLFLLFVFWELTSLTSFMLVGFGHEDLTSRKSAQQALIVTGSGGLAMFAGFILLTQQAGTSSISGLIEVVPEMARTPTLSMALILIFIGAFTKSAQVPFHFWLPNAMAAPTPVSAYLHSATMVKLGVYLLARLDPAFGEWPLWQGTLEAVGSITAGWAMILALRERDLKRILAWSTVATLGALVLLIGLSSPVATVAVATLLLAHALYKAPLFFVAGNIDHGTGTRLLDKLGNLRHAMPLTATAALLAGASMAGLPLTFGFLAKDMIHEAKLAEQVEVLVQIGYGVFGIVAVAVAGVAAIRVFWWHPGVSITPKAHECGASLVLPPLILATMGIVLGVLPWVARSIILSAAQAMSAAPIESIDFHSHLPSMLGTLTITLAVGVVVYLFWDPIHRGFDRLAKHFDWMASVSHYSRVVAGIPKLAAVSTRSIQNGSLPGYMAMLFFAITVAIGLMLWTVRGDLAWPEWEWPSLGVAGACIVVALGALLAGGLERRLVIVLAVGLVGYGSAVFFLFAGAPDVAYTQFIVETVFVVVVASVLLKLKRLGRTTSIRGMRRRPWAMVISVLFASAVTLLFVVVSAGTLDPLLSEYFLAKSVPDAHGRNVVNVILVDFRAIDTLGEITVVMISILAAIPILAALRPPRRRQEART